MKETIIMVDTSTEFNKKIINFLNNSSEIIVPVEVINKLSTEWFNPLQKNIIITDWKHWTHIFDWKNKKNIPALNIKAIDTNWAWDVFRWAYTWWLLNSWKLDKIIKFANKVAWLQCTKKWNLQAVPEKRQRSNLNGGRARISVGFYVFLNKSTQSQ